MYVRFAFDFIGIVGMGSMLLVLLYTCTTLSGFAQSMQSTNYQIEFDSINVGGARSESANYIVEDTTGEIATGPSDSASYQIRAGYQQMSETYIALVPGGDVTLAPALGGLSGGTASGTTTVTVITDSRAGYELSIQASATPAMKHLTESAYVSDYTPSGASPDYTFTIPAGTSTFGFSVSGVDTAQRFLDDGGAMCGVDTGNALYTCWDGLSTTPAVVARRTNENHPVGTQTSLYFRAGIDNNAMQIGGTYRATTTITAIPL